jgi:predicted AAA+ superfamily ATPase
MITRDAFKKLKYLATKFPAVAVVGPRQSGKTTLARMAFPNKPYVSLENPDIRNEALNDPRKFLEKYSKGAILDEAQRAPQIFSYLQQVLDDHKKNGLFILTGSNHFLLAGRISFMYLLPFSHAETIQLTKKANKTITQLFYGGYPAIHSKKINPNDWFAGYIRTYVERDVRQLKNIGNLHLFERFMKLCAARVSQELNLSSLSVDAGVDVKTIQSWMGVLETSFIIYLHRPHFKNYKKRIVRRPKIYFYDTGLVCALLGLKKELHLEDHAMYGHLFENLVITEMLKKRYNNGEVNNLYFWRENSGYELDVLVDTGRGLFPVEIKSAQTFRDNFTKNIDFWKKLTGTKGGAVVYDGRQEFVSKDKIQILNWRDAGKL